MTACLVYCDRCKKQVQEAYRSMGQTSGFYDVVNYPHGNQWARYAREGEHNICDACMWSDPKYVLEHGTQAQRER